MEDCKRTTGQKSQAVLRNRFAALKLGTTDTCCDCEIDLPSDDHGGAGVREGVVTMPRVDDIPGLVDDPLGDAFEIRKELQVCLLSLPSPFMLISTFSGDGRSAACDQRGLEAGGEG